MVVERNTKKGLKMIGKMKADTRTAAEKMAEYKGYIMTIGEKNGRTIYASWIHQYLRAVAESEGKDPTATVGTFFGVESVEKFCALRKNLEF